MSGLVGCCAAWRCQCSLAVAAAGCAGGDARGMRLWGACALLCKACAPLMLDASRRPSVLGPRQHELPRRQKSRRATQSPSRAAGRGRSGGAARAAAQRGKLRRGRRATWANQPGGQVGKICCLRIWLVGPRPGLTWTRTATWVTWARCACGQIGCLCAPPRRPWRKRTTDQEHPLTRAQGPLRPGKRPRGFEDHDGCARGAGRRAEGCAAAGELLSLPSWSSACRRLCALRCAPPARAAAPR